jgi:hypothetical protein
MPFLTDCYNLATHFGVKHFAKGVCGRVAGCEPVEPKTEKSRRDDMIITLHIPQNVEPRRGEINATPSGLGCRFLTDCYILATP